MFDLERSLADWRDQLGRSGQCIDGDLAELEEHLREETAGLVRAGLAEEEAFLIACRRLGRIDLLGAEFEKVNLRSIWVSRSSWMAFGILAYLASSVGARTVSQVVLAGGLFSGLPSRLTGAIAAFGSLAVLLALLALITITFVRHGQRQDTPVPGSTARRCGLAIGMFLWFTLMPGAGLLAGAIAVKAARDMSEFGHATVATSIGTFAISVLMPLLLTTWLLATPRFTRSA
ncbi:MAG TPA: hypothetical protein DD670_16395 [Planctomycetaceae bacterium]|nr:hypothetical protein [Planctomycetaceae bacterium]